MNTKLKKALYESIMKSVAKTVKRTLNESDGQIIPNRMKNPPYSVENDPLVKKSQNRSERLEKIGNR